MDSKCILDRFFLITFSKAFCKMVRMMFGERSIESFDSSIHTPKTRLFLIYLVSRCSVPLMKKKKIISFFTVILMLFIRFDKNKNDYYHRGSYVKYIAHLAI